MPTQQKSKTGMLAFLAARARSLGDALDRRAGALQNWPANSVAAWSFILFVTAFTVHGAVVGAGSTLHFDVLEAYAWGKEFQLGYNQHGPFWAWIAGAWFLLFPVTNASFVLLQAINCGLGVLGAWLLTGLFARGWTRHAAALMLVATPLYTFLGFKYNANIIFISLWPWTLYFFVKSVDGLKARDAVLFGLFSAACILSKYYAVVLLITCGLSLFFHQNGRKYMLSPLPWLAAAVFSACVLPHVLWALNNGAPPVAYAMSITGKGLAFAIENAGRFAVQNAFNLSGVAAIILLTRWIQGASATNSPLERLPQSRRNFLAVLVLAPPLLTLAFGVILRLETNPNMGIGIFPLMPLFLMQLFPSLDGRRCFALAGIAAMAVTVGAAAGAPIERAVAIKNKRVAGYALARELAAAVTPLWHAETHTPLRYAGGDRHLSDGLSFYSEDHPSSFAELSFTRSRWVTPENLKKYGLLIACAHEDEGCVGKAAQFVSGNWKKISIGVSRTWGGRSGPEVPFDIFIMYPQAG
jgi:4-amino-4-deoxy-L-arabinose transferase-like glycosyltransferase